MNPYQPSSISDSVLPGWPVGVGLAAVLRWLRFRDPSGAAAQPHSLLHPGQRDQHLKDGGEMGSLRHGCTQKGARHRDNACPRPPCVFIYLDNKLVFSVRPLGLVMWDFSHIIKHISVSVRRASTPRRGLTLRRWRRKWWTSLATSGLCSSLVSTKLSSSQVTTRPLFTVHLDVWSKAQRMQKSSRYHESMEPVKYRVTENVPLFVCFFAFQVPVCRKMTWSLPSTGLEFIL